MLIALEGIDGTGKSSLAANLAKRARENGLGVHVVSFPHYHDTAFGELIALYLNGRFGDVHHVSEYLSSLLFAAERYEYRSKLRELARQFDVILVDRYVGSNIAYNCAKVPAQNWHELAHWIEHLEFDMFRVPRPDAQVLLRLDATVAADFLGRRTKKTYTEHKDGYESNSPFLENCGRVYDWLARQGALAPWIVTDVARPRTIRPKEAIANEVWQALLETLDGLTPQGVLSVDQPLRLFDGQQDV